MNIMEKYSYFAPVYRVMRDENFTVAQVREQVLAIADAIKRGDQPSDMRHHNFPGRLNTGQVYFFRAHDRGAVAYVQDQDDVLFSHGVHWTVPAAEAADREHLVGRSDRRQVARGLEIFLVLFSETLSLPRAVPFSVSREARNLRRL